MSASIRLNKYLAHTLGISRREADMRIQEGAVLVNGKPASLGNVVQPGRDSISVNKQTVSPKTKRYSYVLLNKPVGYVCSRKQQGSPTIYALLPRHYSNLKVAGRLDKDSCGLVLLTDDGDTIFQLTHPKFGKRKVYHAGLNKPLKDSDKHKIETGIQLEDGESKLQIASITLKNPKTANPKPNTYKITMQEGRNRQIRRTFKSLGYEVAHLERIKLGAFSLTDLQNKPYLQI